MVNEGMKNEQDREHKSQLLEETCMGSNDLFENYELFQQVVGVDFQIMKENYQQVQDSV